MKYIGLFVLLVGTMLFTRQTVNIGQDIDLGSIVNIALADDIESVDIVCSSGDYGQCFIPVGGFCHIYATIEIWGDCEYSGYQDDYCGEDDIFDDCGGYGDGH